MGLFDVFKKKDCEICGKEVGIFGYKKLEDGEICKDCVKLLSPWFDDRRHSTVEQIKAQLAYREENRRQLDAFRPTISIGSLYEIKVELVDGVPTRFVVTRDNYLEENADLIRFDQVRSFEIDIREDRDEQQYRNSEGNMVSYNPPRYEYSYDFYCKLLVDSPYFDDIRVRFNSSTLNLETVMRKSSSGIGQFLMTNDFDPMLYPEYREYKAMCEQLEQIFNAGMQGKPLPENAPAEPVVQPKAQPVPTAVVVASVAQTWRCASCGSENEGKFCQNCGAGKPAPKAAAGWTCFCGTVNTGKFCSDCGTQQFTPDEIECSECSWTVEEPGQIPQFCPNCGKQFNNDDIA